MAQGAPGEQVYTPQVSAEDLPRKITPRMEAVPVGQAFEQAFDASNRKYQADSATWAGDQLAQARIKAVSDLETAKANAPAGDQTGFTEKYLAGFDKDTADLAQSAGGNSAASAMITKGVQNLRDTLFEHTKQWEAQQNVAYRANSFQNNLSSQLPIVEAHPELRTQVGSTLMDQLNATGAEPARRLPLARQMDEQLSLAAANGYTRQNPQAMYQALNDPDNAPANIKSVISGLNDQQREMVLTKVKGQIAVGLANNVVDTFRTQGPDAGNKARQGIDGLNQPDDIKQAIYAKIEQGVNQWHQESRQQATPNIVALESRIASGDAGEPDKRTAWDLYRRGALDTNQLASAVSSIERSEVRHQEDDANLKFVTNAFQQSTPLDPKNKDVQNGADLLFTNQTQGMQTGSPGYVNSAIDIVRRVGVVPSSTMAWSRANLTSGDPATAARAADLVERMAEVNPRAEMFVEDPKLKAMANSINTAVKAGTDPTTAVTLARSNTSMPDIEQKLLEARWKAVAPDKSSQSALTGLLKSVPAIKPGFFSSVPAIPPLMQGEFDNLSHQYFTTTGGNLQQARQLAARDVEKTWGVSEVNGQRELMQYAPEAMFPGLSAAVVRSDIASTVASNAEQFANVDPSKVRLTATDRTARTRGTDWTLSVPDKFGAYDVVRGKDGNPLTYRLPVSSNDYNAVKQRQNQADLQKARMEQAIDRDAQEGQMRAIEEQGAQ